MRKWVITLFLTVCLFLVILSTVLVFLNRVYVHKMETAISKNAELNQRLAEEEEQILSLRKSVASRQKSLAELKSKLRKSEKELQEIREMEIKLRRFLDMKHSQPQTEKYSHQGGFKTNASPDSVEIPLDNSTSGIDFGQIVSYSLTLKESLREVVSSLEKQREKLSHTPSVLPVKGDEVWLSSDFGNRVHPKTGRREFHSGVDVAGGYKTPIIAPADGVVASIGNNRLMGKNLWIRHREDLRTTYGHLHTIAVEKGEKVRRGDVIGYMGNTGRSTGTHVHYEVVEEGEARDPMQYILDRESGTLSLR